MLAKSLNGIAFSFSCLLLFCCTMVLSLSAAVPAVRSLNRCRSQEGPKWSIGLRFSQVDWVG